MNNAASPERTEAKKDGIEKKEMSRGRERKEHSKRRNEVGRAGGRALAFPFVRNERTVRRAPRCLHWHPMAPCLSPDEGE